MPNKSFHWKPFPLRSKVSSEFHVRVIEASMRLLSDWKFVVSLAAAIAAVIVPVWLWQADLSSKSLAITLSTCISLQPAEKESLQGIEISFEGKRLENPHLVILEITNDGSKPILANDFESPLEIRLASETHFLHSRITEKIPKDIDTDLSIEKNRVSLKLESKQVV